MDQHSSIAIVISRQLVSPEIRDAETKKARVRVGERDSEEETTGI